MKSSIDWLLFFFLLPIVGAGLITMNSFMGETSFVGKQLIWVGLGLALFFLFSFVDFRFLRRTDVLVTLFIILISFLLFLLFFGSSVRGAKSWFQFGAFAWQPTDFMKLVLILILAKYFSRRHVEIRHIKHIAISGLYALIPFSLVFFQPDLGSAIIIFLIWLGIAIVAGISKKHLLAIFLITLVVLSALWFFALHPYQKERIVAFIHPLADLSGAGYNAYQSTIAVGSGQLMGKGVGYGTQSRLQFLPEYETDFIFAAFAEEWGFVGSALILILFGLVIWRILANAMVAASNFEMLFGIGIAILFVSQIAVNIGMNVGLLPVTGLPLPFMSYGGSHLISEFIALGILMGMRRTRRIAHPDDLKHEFVGF